LITINYHPAIHEGDQIRDLIPHDC
jgi:hypothetical protein